MAVAVRTKRGASADSGQLWSAIESGNHRLLEEILADGPAINLTDKDGVSPLLHAACYDRIEVIRTLIERGANVNAVRVDGFTPLLLAIFFGHADVVRVLVESGADVTATTRFGTSAQMWATARGFYDISDYLQQRDVQSPVAVDPLKNPIVVPDALLAAPVEANALQPTTHNNNPSDSSGNGPTETKNSRGRNVQREPVAVRALKDPPEIWDLVHENRSNFNPSATFVSRLMSMQRGTVAVVATILVAMISVPAVMKWKAGAARSAIVTPVVLSDTSNANGVTPPELKSVSESTGEAPTSTASENNSPPTSELQGPSPAANGSRGIETVGAHSRVSSEQRSRRSARPQGQRSDAASNTTIGSENTADARQSTPTPTVDSKSNTNTRSIDSAAVKKPSVVITNSQLIDRPSGSRTAKPKVIQWP